ncbi:hypothetical protein MVEN_00717200 [Mycena venus]|uniref:Malate dehydrogenase n=1 Tax=Mycena venus TaxID=2733690 RepID=A0A8H6YEY1_9AGAR|nr:hypothetical protein MVEN_00717200 [Mycena venus]
MLSFQLIPLFFAFAAPLVSAGPPLFVRKYEGCDTSKAVMDLPPNQTTLVAPATAPLFVLLGVGVQNYTCSGTTFASIGAVASLFDISCLAGTSKFASIQNTAFNVWDHVPSSVPSTAIGPLVGAPYLDGFHYFVTSPLRHGYLAQMGFHLYRVAGDLASQVFRIDTVNGQPPTSCVAGSPPISVKYTSKYYLF